MFTDEVVGERITELLNKTGITKDQFNNWLSTPPRDTVVRVNTSVQTRRDASDALATTLKEQYSQRPELSPPTIHPHPLLDDVLVLKSSNPNVCPAPDPQSRPEVIVDRLCGQAVLRGADVFVPGVMGMPAYLKDGAEVDVFADVEGKCLKGLAKPFLGGTKKFLGVGLLLVSRGDIFKAGMEKGVAIRMTLPLIDCPSLNEAAARGGFMLQNLPSIICVHSLLGNDIRPDLVVLDMCAAPGGKTTHLANLLSSRNGTVIALDKSKNRLEQVRANAERQGLANVRVFLQDATKCKSDVKSSCDKLNFSPPYAPGSFSKILLDAPCSASGQRPQFENEMTLRQADSHPKLQRKLFESAVGLLEAGGELVYSTCSIMTEENEELVAWAMEKFGGKIEIVPFQPAGVGGPGIQVSGLAKSEADCVRRFFVSDSYDTIGFFIAKFKRM